MNALRNLLALGAAACLLTACGGSGGDTVVNPITTPPPVQDYSGPDPATADVQSFKTNVWDNLTDPANCSNCHIEGGQAPYFARQDDINLAYEAANDLVDLEEPDLSRLVTKVEGGHNCWRDSDAACAGDMTTWISNWANLAIAGSGNEIDFESPIIKDIGTSKSFPAESDLFTAPNGDSLYDLLTTYCADCHNGNATFPQSPYFADADVDTAYAAARTKINLDSPDNSRLVLRLRNEFHNCWDDCESNADEMEAKITAFANQIPLSTVNNEFVTSKALGLLDGIIASGGNRYEANAIARYEFKTGEGPVAFDTSGVTPALDLNISGDVEWFGGYGINIRSGKAQGSTLASKKLHDLIKATGEYAIEAWVVPGNVTQEESRIISYSGGPDVRNFSLNQTLYNYQAFTRSSVTDENGAPALSTADADEDLQASLQHVVVNFDPINGRSIFVNGEFTDDSDAAGGGNFNDWDDTFAFVLGNEVSNDRQFVGVMRMVVIHNRVLTEEQIFQNFDAGVGQKFFLLFSVSDIINEPESYIYFEVSQFDSYSYLFSEPNFLSLDDSVAPSDLVVRGMRIGINGQEAEVGQAFANLDTTIDSPPYSSETGLQLSPLGTIIALDKGPEVDEFFLTFEQLGDEEYARTPDAGLEPADPTDIERASDIGLRIFDELNFTMSRVTGVSTQQTDVRETFNTIRQQLPTAENLGGFLASHQVGMAQLAIEYCNALVDDNSLRNDFFGNLDFDRSVTAVYGSQVDRDLVINPIIDRIVGNGLATQPDADDIRSELNRLMGILDDCADNNSCSNDRSRVIAKASCASVIGSAAVMIQ